ncbi:Glutathione reductase OS=Bosea thiooxidans OX=53254 GN=ARD30_01405 PE=3 SV=1 [Bosea thiooxidans]
MAEFDVDLFVIGAGSGGTRAARIAAGHGARVMIAEEDRIGGTCVIRGCVPKKLFVYASRFAEDFEDAAGFGWTLGAKPSFDWPTLRDAVANEVTRLSGLYRKGLEGVKAQIREERAVVEGPHEVRLQKSGHLVRARHILFATGGWPSFDPPIPGGDLAISSNEIFHLPALPKRMLVVGGGYIALEFASLFARLGVAVDGAAPRRQHPARLR